MSTQVAMASPVAAEGASAVERRVLVVAYNFPPVGGAGVQRPVKWVKYLPQLGWQPTVLTVSNPSVPVRDESLLADVPASVKIVTARTREPGYAVKQSLAQQGAAVSLSSRIVGGLKATAKRVLKTALQPDPQVLWLADATRVARALLKATPHDAIVVTAPPYSSFFLGRRLQREFGIPLVLDFRDEWDNSSRYLENAAKDSFSRWIQERMQRSLLQSANAVVATTQASTSALAERSRAAGGNGRAECVYNGYDEDDVAPSDEPVSAAFACEPGVFRLVYTGTLWNLTTIEPVVKAIQAVHVQAPQLLSRFELVCVGRKTPEQVAILETLVGTAARVRMLDYCPHREVVQWQRSAGALCLLLSDVPGGERVIPAKLFEYLAQRKPLLAVTPQGETASIVERFHPGSAFRHEQTAALAQWLTDRLRNTAPAAMIATADVTEFSRRTQAARLAALLCDLASVRRGPC